MPAKQPHFRPNTPVTHRTFGVGRVLGEWGRLEVELGENTRVSYTCPGIYDCEFTVGPDRVLHCCRGEYLERIGKAPTRAQALSNLSRATIASLAVKKGPATILSASMTTY